MHSERFVKEKLAVRGEDAVGRVLAIEDAPEEEPAESARLWQRGMGLTMLRLKVQENYKSISHVEQYRLPPDEDLKSEPEHPNW